MSLSMEDAQQVVVAAAHIAATQRTKRSRMLPSVIGGPGGCLGFMLKRFPRTTSGQAYLLIPISGGLFCFDTVRCVDRLVRLSNRMQLYEAFPICRLLTEKLDVKVDTRHEVSLRF